MKLKLEVQLFLNEEKELNYYQVAVRSTMLVNITSQNVTAIIQG